MAVKSIDLSVGQVWKTVRGETVTIVGKSESSVLKWKTDFVMLSGERALCNDMGTMTNLDQLDCCLRVPAEFDDHEALTFHPLPTAEPEQSNEVVSAQTNDGQPLPHDDELVKMPSGPEVLLARKVLRNSTFGKLGVGIGDITSAAKGSGVRYNTGKPPLELIPLSLLAGYHQHQLDYADLSNERQCAIAALDALGIFQAREGKLLDVLDVLYALGDGWDECAQVFDYGRRKYAEWNWAKGMPWSVPIACAARHLRAIIRGEQTDPESGLSHRGHVFCNIVMLATYMGTFPEGDDRPAKGMLL